MLDYQIQIKRLPSLLTLIIWMSACALNNQSTIFQPESDQITVLEFIPNSWDLQPNAKNELFKLIRRIKDHKIEIDEVRIFAWSDHEYPDQFASKNNKDIKLARKRAFEIEDFLKYYLPTRTDFDSYNMARRPNHLSALLTPEDNIFKNEFEQAGLSSVKLHDGKMAFTKASKAIVMISPSRPHM